MYHLLLFFGFIGDIERSAETRIEIEQEWSAYVSESVSPIQSLVYLM